MELTAILAIATIVLPLAGAALVVPASALGRTARDLVALVATGATLLASVSLALSMSGEYPATIGVNVLLGEATLVVDAAGHLFAVLVAFVWFCCTLASLDYLATDEKASRYQAVSLVVLSAMMGVGFAGDLVMLFLFFEVAGVTSYLLVVHKGTARAQAAAGKYLAMTLASGFAFSHFRLNNLGHFPLFDGIEEAVVLSTGWRLFSLNSQALLAWRSLGAAEATLYLEDDKENLRDLLQRDAGIETALTVYGSVPLITSRIPIKGVRSDTPLLSDRGDAYRVQVRAGQSVLTSETDFSLLGRLDELQQLGCARFVLELAHLGPFSERGKKVLDALRRGREVPGTSPFNYDAGME